MQKVAYLCDNKTKQIENMTYTIKSKGAGVKQMTLENGQIVSICKRRSYGNRYHWIIRKDCQRIAAGLTIKQCAEDFIRNAK